MSDKVNDVKLEPLGPLNILETARLENLLKVLALYNPFEELPEGHPDGYKPEELMIEGIEYNETK